MCTDSPRLHAILQGLQTGLDQVERLEKQSGAGPTEGATHESFDCWVSLKRGLYKDMRREEVWSILHFNLNMYHQKKGGVSTCQNDVPMP